MLHLDKIVSCCCWGRHVGVHAHVGVGAMHSMWGPAVASCVFLYCSMSDSLRYGLTLTTELSISFWLGQIASELLDLPVSISRAEIKGIHHQSWIFM